MSFDNITYERKGRIAYLTLDRPEKLNALNPGMMSDLREALEELFSGMWTASRIAY